MVLVSACLAAYPCKYNGQDNRHPLIQQLVAEGMALPICPEQLGGETTPRPAAEIKGGQGMEVWQGQADVINQQGELVTPAFCTGAERCLKIAQALNIKVAIMKERSPSCGVYQVYDGNFNHTIMAGSGVTSALLKNNGIIVMSEEDDVTTIMEVIAREST